MSGLLQELLSIIAFAMISADQVGGRRRSFADGGGMAAYGWSASVSALYPESLGAYVGRPIRTAANLVADGVKFILQGRLDAACSRL